ncbi:MAG TPA: LuxR C-terminal-related transcriptional regulator [Streptosporangiaceae bacterium]|jgi:DNA-binding CsgD family transcriptional regulator
MGQWPFVGRKAELDGIRSAFADSAASGVIVAGRAGVGKTRLAREALGLLAGDQCKIVWVAATRTAGSIPFGAVAHLMPDDWRPDGDRLSVLAAIAARVRTWSKRGRVAVGVDDAHLLDSGSAAVLAHLAAQRLAFLLVTVRGELRAPDAITALWKDGSAHRLELTELPADAVDRLIDHALAGDIEGYSRMLCHRTAAGNPLALRELLLGALDDGTLRRRYGVWRFEGRFSPSGRIRELVAERLTTVEPAAELVLELLACGEPLGMATLERLAGPAAVAAAEASEMVTAERTGARLCLRLAHPLYGEVLRETMSTGRARQLWRRLAGAVLAGPMRRREDALRAGIWQVEGGEVVRPDVVRRGARDAMDRADLELAERLARAARAAGPDDEIDRLLANILALRGRGAEARAVLPVHPPPPGRERVRWAVTRAKTLYSEFGDVPEAERVLDLGAVESGGEMAEAVRAWLQLFDGRCASALARTRQVLASPSAGERAVILAVSAGTAAAGFLGRADEAEHLGRRGLALARRYRPDTSWSLIEVGYGRCLAHLALGEPAKAWDVADSGYRAAVAADVPLMVAGWAGIRGLAETAQGRPVSAGKSLREAVAVLKDTDAFRLAWCFHGALAAATALGGNGGGSGGGSGDTGGNSGGNSGGNGDNHHGGDNGDNHHGGEARAWLGEAERLGGQRHRLFLPWYRLWEAWTLAAAGDTTAAEASCDEAAGLARAAELPTVEAAALYDKVRLGAGKQPRLTELTTTLGIAMAAAMATAARGLDGADGDALTEAGGTFAALGQHLLAAEAFGAAAHAYRQAGRRTGAALSLERAAELRARCEGATTPLLSRTPAIGRLTRREREVALLAARHSSRQVAERLGLSVATVNNHLARAYTKLGVSRRAQLAALIGAAHTLDS